MDTSSPGGYRDRAVGRRLASRVTDPRPPPQDPSDHAVHDAEQIVCDAWVQVLVEHRDRAQAAMQAASVHCDAARRRLSETLVARAPGGIAAAHADLENALAAERRASRSYEQSHEGLVLELDLLAWRAIERKVDACIVRNGEPTTPAGTEQEAQDPVRRVPALSRFSRRFLPWCLYVAASFTAGGWSS